MSYAFAGMSNVISVIITKNGDYAQLEPADVVSYSVFDIKGNIIANLKNVEVPVTDDNRTFLRIDIPAEANSLAEGEVFSNRIVIINYTLNGVMNTVRQTYRIIPFAPYSCSESDVRTILGVSEKDLSDDMIDLYAAYLKAKQRSDKIEEALSAGTIKTNVANRIVAIYAALAFRNTLPLLIAKIESDNIVSQTRFTMSMDDFMQLFDNLEDELDDLFADLEDETTNNRMPSDLFVIGNLTDTFTGG